ncbi:MAG TPA: prepilin-type N-terminal cleavage/methylation domain-containing protein, partial [Pseudomonadaceae bacterium]|nr:prepilin-type N-terminal cleavage/methylation domain-containing protein [Pseudomonadaceae bacterium]
MKRISANAGFTLLELLVAMAVTALVGVLAWQFLDSALRVSAQNEALLEDVNALEQFWHLLDMDLQQSRGSFSFADDETPGGPFASNDFVGGEALLPVAEQLPIESGEQPWLLLLRDVGQHPLQPRRPALQRVLYSLRDGALWRTTWVERHLGGAPERVSRRVLVEGLEGLALHFLAAGDMGSGATWTAAWPLEQNSGFGEAASETAGPITSLPRALSLTLHTEALG